MFEPQKIKYNFGGGNSLVQTIWNSPKKKYVGVVCAGERPQRQASSDKKGVVHPFVVIPCRPVTLIVVCGHISYPLLLIKLRFRNVPPSQANAVLVSSLSLPVQFYLSSFVA